VFRTSIYSISDKICHFSLYRTTLFRQRYSQKNGDLPYRCFLTFIITMFMRRLRMELSNTLGFLSFQFATSQSEALSSVPISRDIKSLTWYDCDIIRLDYQPVFLAPSPNSSERRKLALWHQVRSLGEIGYVRLDKIVKIPAMATPNSLDMPPKRTKKIRLSINITHRASLRERNLSTWRMNMIDIQVCAALKGIISRPFWS